MDKILTKKILGLKVEDILKCVLLVGVGYCIAVMLGNCNCVEGWTCKRTSPMPDTCSAEMCARNMSPDTLGAHATCNDCPGWIIDLKGDKAGIPYIRDLSFKCVNEGDDPPTKDECDNWRQDKVSEYIEAHAIADKYQQGGIAPNCPKPPPPPPTPPLKCREYNCPEGMEKKNQNKKQGTDPISNCCTAESKETCTYTGDSTGDVVELNKEWWQGADIEDKSCSTEIQNCRADMLNWRKKYSNTEYGKKPYKGFCLQTVSDLKGGGTRGSCGREVDKEHGFIANTGTIGVGLKDPETECKNTDDNQGNFAWVAESDTRGIHSCNPHCPS